MRNMSYRNHYSGSPWQQGGPPFGVGNYGQNYGGYNDNYPMMNAGYGRSQGGYGGMYGGGGMGQMRSMGYGGPSPSRYGNDRMGGGGRQMMSRGQMQRKRLPQRSPVGGPRPKRPNLSGSGSGGDRRMSKPRRRRDSRGGSKGRGRSDEDDAYNPAEPTDDASDIEFMDGFESWHGSGDEADDEEVGTAKENGDQNLEEVGEGENKDDSKPSQKKLICYVCKVTCATEKVYRKHQNSKTHTEKIDELVSIRREKRQGSQDDDKGSDKESKDGKKKVRKPGNWCTVCEIVFNGNFLAHRRTKEHRKKRDKKYPKCRPCRLGFSSSEEYRDHYKSEDHKQKSAEFHYLKGLESGSDNDEAAIKPIKLEPEEEVKNEAVEEKIEESIADEEEVPKEKTDEDSVKTEIKTESDAEGEGAEKKEKDDKDKKESDKAQEKKKPREPKASGQSFVISVQGYYCKLCRKFFKDVSVAKSKHCRSIMHVEAFKKAMEDALIQEEERQKLAEEQDKIDREAAEAAELAADVAAVERAAKEAIKREAAKKKAEAKKGQDVEMKDVDQAAESGKGDKDEEKMDTTASDQKVENGSKESDQAAVKVEVKEEKVDDEKSEAIEESADGEEEGDEEPEKVKEEVTTSPATRRGRGRGRGRKRR